jgi:hypothetical protein
MPTSRVDICGAANWTPVANSMTRKAMGSDGSTGAGTGYIARHNSHNPHDRFQRFSAMARFVSRIDSHFRCDRLLPPGTFAARALLT